MCAMVSGLVSGRTLHDFARGLHLQRCLALDATAQWEAKHLSGWADGMLADSFEALLAALFMDRGFNAAKTLVLRLIKVGCPVSSTRENSLSRCLLKRAKQGPAEEGFAQKSHADLITFNTAVVTSCNTLADCTSIADPLGW